MKIVNSKSTKEEIRTATHYATGKNGQEIYLICRDQVCPVCKTDKDCIPGLDAYHCQKCKKMYPTESGVRGGWRDLPKEKKRKK